MALLRVTPEELQGVGQNLLVTATELEQLLQRLDNQVRTAQNGWDGLAQTGYVEKYESLKREFAQMPQLVDDLGRRTIDAAQTFQNIDTELSQKLRI